ncbi:hypothetical protein, partial [Streptomyces anthocyanicus]
MPLNRRTFLESSAALGAGAALAAGTAAPAEAHGARPRPAKRYSFTVMG